MQKLFFVFILFATHYSCSQSTPYLKVDYGKLEQLTIDSTSNSYYSLLMDRYQKGDTTLSNDEYRILYYGYTFQKEYDPWWRSSQIETLEIIYSKEEYSQNDCDTIVKYATESISDFPFDLRQINMIGYAYHLKDNDSIALKWASKRNGIVDAILSSGDGRTCESAFSVISVSHEYEILKVFGLSSKTQSLSSDNRCDCLTIETPSGKTDYMYFDIWRTMQVKMEEFSQ